VGFADSIDAKKFEVGSDVSAEVRRATDQLAQHIANLVSGRVLQIRGIG